MENVDAFKDISVDEDEHEKSLQAAADDKKGNLLPKGVVSLKNIYELKNLFQVPRNIKTLVPP